MGIFNFKKKEKNRTIQTPQNNDKCYSITNNEGRLEIEYIDKNPKVGQIYDTTKLIIDGMNENLANCRISWYGSDDTEAVHDNQKLIARKYAYKDILVELDLNRLYRDNNYVDVLMKSLLNEARVERYLNDGLSDNPEKPCGKYVGGVRLDGDRYVKIFDVDTGRNSHYSPEMKNKRHRYKRAQEQARKRIIKEKQAKIDDLQSEIDQLRQ